MYKKNYYSGNHVTRVDFMHKRAPHEYFCLIFITRNSKIKKIVSERGVFYEKTTFFNSLCFGNASVDGW